MPLKTTQEPEPLKKKQGAVAGAGAAKKFTGSPTLLLVFVDYCLATRFSSSIIDYGFSTRLRSGQFWGHSAFSQTLIWRHSSNWIIESLDDWSFSFQRLLRGIRWPGGCSSLSRRHLDILKRENVQPFQTGRWHCYPNHNFFFNGFHIILVSGPVDDFLSGQSW